MLPPWQFQKDKTHGNMLWPGPGLLSHVQYCTVTLREKNSSGCDDSMTGTGATPTPVTGTVTELKHQLVPVSTPAVHKERELQMWAHLGRHEAAGISWEEVEEKA